MWKLALDELVLVLDIACLSIMVANLLDLIEADFEMVVVDDILAKRCHIMHLCRWQVRGCVFIP